MADNTILNPGAGGDVSASDDIGGVKFQRVKLTLGGDGVNGGDLSTSNPMPVALAVGAPTGAAQAATGLSLVSIDNKLPASLGSKAAAGSVSVVPASDATFSFIPAPGALTNRSGTVAAGGSAQSLAPANATRRGWALQNLSTGDLWVNEFGTTAAAAQPSMRIVAGGLYESPPGGGGGVGALSLFGAITGQAFTAKEW